ncbi:hypothetical protein TH53_19735 [Pedobacter lusitanus]|uniref:Uncharacterized protein n=1 Tax=Pedobacter lusitanus TaxID=1503925 RepID=A0A0D0GDZ8_9SPHI|nr:hypothetical protein [Pedobacter lusitanus]KIO75572.1 hypothetical protein TH53_19735 [Pedobacter lusitanus]
MTEDHAYLYSEPKKPWNKNVNLEEAWQTIFDEYTTLTNDTRGQHVFSLIKEITVLNSKLYVIQQAVSFLARQFDVRLCDMLRSMGFMFQYNPESMDKDLKMTISTAKSLLMSRAEAQAEFDKLDNDAGKATEKDYDALIAQLSKFLGFWINAKESTVMNFINYLEMFKQENKPQANG